MSISNIYLDYNATTPVDDRVLEAMLPYFSTQFGNASSKTHSFGWTAKDAVEKSRQEVADLLNCIPQEIIFTAGATESINIAIKSVAEIYVNKGKHIVTAATEHKAVLDTCEYLEKKGYSITVLPVNREGNIDLKELESSITPQTILVCIMFANNETGVIHPIEEIANIVHEKGSIFMCDATQAVGKIKVDVQQYNIDLLAMSAHKMYGPKGVGALFIRRKNPRVTIAAQTHGGGHENGLRSGTLNVPGIVGLGMACKIAEEEMWENSIKLSRLRTTLEQGFVELGNIFVNGDIRNRLANVSNLCFTVIKADRLISKTPTIAVATGSACSSAIASPSHVLKAMGLSDEMAYASVRFSLGKNNTQEEIIATLNSYKKVLSIGE